MPSNVGMIRCGPSHLPRTLGTSRILPETQRIQETPPTKSFRGSCRRSPSLHSLHSLLTVDTSLALAKQTTDAQTGARNEALEVSENSQVEASTPGPLYLVEPKPRGRRTSPNPRRRASPQWCRIKTGAFAGMRKCGCAADHPCFSVNKCSCNLRPCTARMPPTSSCSRCQRQREPGQARFRT